MRLCLFLSLFALLISLQIQSEPKEEDTIYELILQEPYHDIKMQLGAKLGKLGTRESMDFLRKLLENPYYWNREAALEGIFLENRIEFKEILIKQFLTDSILRPKIRKGIISQISFYIDDIKQIYEKEKSPTTRGLLLSLIAISPDSEVYFQKITEDKNKKFQTNKETVDKER